jgi:hypothetical protein
MTDKKEQTSRAWQLVQVVLFERNALETYSSMVLSSSRPCPKRNRERELTAEMESHLQMRTDDHLRALRPRWRLGPHARMSHMLVGVSSSDPLTYLSVAALLSFITLLACWIPARRAMRVDPMMALRYE